jgi:hypothetical protein
VRPARRTRLHFEEITKTTIEGIAECLARFYPNHLGLIVQKVADRLIGKHIAGSVENNPADFGCTRDPTFFQPLSQIPYDWH